MRIHILGTDPAYPDLWKSLSALLNGELNAVVGVTTGSDICAAVQVLGLDHWDAVRLQDGHAISARDDVDDVSPYICWFGRNTDAKLAVQRHFVNPIVDALGGPRP